MRVPWIVHHKKEEKFSLTCHIWIAGPICNSTNYHFFRLVTGLCAFSLSSGQEIEMFQNRNMLALLCGLFSGQNLLNMCSRCKYWIAVLIWWPFSLFTLDLAWIQPRKHVIAGSWPVLSPSSKLFTNSFYCPHLALIQVMWDLKAEHKKTFPFTLVGCTNGVSVHWSQFFYC